MADYKDQTTGGVCSNTSTCRCWWRSRKSYYNTISCPGPFFLIDNHYIEHVHTTHNTHYIYLLLGKRQRNTIRNNNTIDTNEFKRISHFSLSPSLVQPLHLLLKEVLHALSSKSKSLQVDNQNFCLQRINKHQNCRRWAKMPTRLTPL